MKYSLTLSTILLLSVIGCEFAKSVKDFKDELLIQTLDTYTMSPNNLYGAKYEIDYRDKNPQRFDIIEFKYEDETYDETDFYSSSQHVSRVIGLPNENIEIRNGYLYIDDKFLEETFIPDSLRTNDWRRTITLKEDEYYLMIDNRLMVNNDTINTRSYIPYDSRIIGTIQKRKIVGTTNLNKD